MLKNYLKITMRNLLRNKGYSLINIGGLAVGMAVAISIGLWIYDELSFDKQAENYDRVAVVMQHIDIDGGTESWSSNSYQVGPELRNKYGRYFKHVVMSTFAQRSILSFKDQTFNKTGNFMETDAPELLSLNMLEGTRAGLKDLNSILLSASAAETLFGDKSPLGKVLRIDDKVDVSVAGIYQDLPDNSSFDGLDFIAPLDLYLKNYDTNISWHNNWLTTFVELDEKADLEATSIAIKDAKLKNYTQYNPRLFLHPLSKWHLYSNFENGVNTGGRIEFVWLFGIIGFFVLLLASINFMNLSTARSAVRAKEVGVRKVIGSARRQLIAQFFTESLVVVLLAFLISILLVQLALPWFNEIADKNLVILRASLPFWLMCIAFVFLTALLSGSYPAFYLSSLKPVKVLKGAFKAGRFASLPRKTLVVIQFTVCITLCIATIVVYKQIQFVKDRPVGYNLSGLITIPIKTPEVKANYEAFRNRLLSTPAVSGVSKSECTVSDIWWSDSGFKWKGKDPDFQDNIFRGAIDADFGKTVGWKIKKGRDFSRKLSTDSAAMILNEAAVKYMGLENPVGEQIKAYEKNYTVIGVVEDMVSQSLYRPVGQTVYRIDSPDQSHFINIRIHPGVSMGAAVKEIESIFKKLNSATPFEYNFTDDEYAEKYEDEQQIGSLAGIFAGLAVFISALGLFGLASFVAEQRKKEIGIRKVLGASVADLWRMLSGDFVVLVMISCVLAAPIAYFYLQDWLLDYEFRTEISWWVFIIAGLGAMGVTLCTVSIQAIKAAVVNPVKSLRTE